VVSSRAVGFDRMLEVIREDVAMPVIFGEAKKGMCMIEHGVCGAQEIWLESFELTVAQAQKLHDHGVHHSITNRLLEPFMHINQVLTGDQWGNFFNLRIAKPADPTIRELALQMQELINSTEDTGNHIPFLLSEEDSLPLLDQVKISAARCARMSYTPVGCAFADINKDLALADKLLRDHHMSCFEHQLFKLENDVSVLDLYSGIDSPIKLPYVSARSIIQIGNDFTHTTSI
jgi:hypothetical protein